MEQDSIVFSNTEFKFDSRDWPSWEGDNILPFNMKSDSLKIEDNVNRPAHYTTGSTEAIDVIEDTIKYAPDPMKGFLQGQVMKYILRLWHKENVKEDAQKAEWYLKKLIDTL